MIDAASDHGISQLNWLRVRPKGTAGLVASLPVIIGYVTLIWVTYEAIEHVTWQSYVSASVIHGLGMVGIWRYSWLVLNMIRALIYRYEHFPKLRARADALAPEAKYPDSVYFIIPTLLEEEWVSRRVLNSIMEQASELPCKTSLFIATGSEKEDDLLTKIVKQNPLGEYVDVYLLRQDSKRGGMGNALRAAARRWRGEQAAVFLMDGDTVLGPGVMRKVLPFFNLMPDLGGMTTDNIALTRGPTWYRDWYNLRFSMRNRYMCSVSLSHKLLTLTGRFSAFRGAIAFSQDFLQLLEDDGIPHWLYGKIEFLTGDDKSTCYHLLQTGWNMLYIPDAWVYCMESAGKNPLAGTVAKMHRWFGNMMRNNWRGILLGPDRIGFFPWYSIVDQRLSIWTTLLGPTAIILLALARSPLYLLYYSVWVMISRLIYLIVLSLEGHRVTWRDLPLVVITQWFGSIIKIQCLSDLRRQKWGEARSLQYNPKATTQSQDGTLGTLQRLVWSTAFVVCVVYLISGVLRTPLR